jgi:hypothetical protein
MIILQRLSFQQDRRGQIALAKKPFLTAKWIPTFVGKTKRQINLDLKTVHFFSKKIF